MAQPGAGSGERATEFSLMPRFCRGATETVAAEAAGRRVAGSWRIAVRFVVSGRPVAGPPVVVAVVGKQSAVVEFDIAAADIAERKAECVDSAGIHRQSERSIDTSSSRIDRMMDCTPIEFGKLGLTKELRLTES